MTAVADLKASGGKVLDGELAFKLHDTFGFPLDLTQDVAREHGLTRRRSRVRRRHGRASASRPRAAGKFKMAAGLEYTGDKTDVPRHTNGFRATPRVTALYVDGASGRHRCSRARQAWWCWTTRRSTRSPAARSGDQGTLVGGCGCVQRGRHDQGAGRRVRPPGHARPMVR